MPAGTIQEQEQQYEAQRRYSSQANFVINKLEEIKPSVAPKRWFWELLQNASDTGKPVDIRVILEHDKLIFEHNGKPFRYKDTMNLIVPDTDKKDDQEDSDAPKVQVGQFGTGFISTHILGLKVEVQGYLMGGDEGESFKFTLDRTQKGDKGAIIKSMGETEKDFKRSRSNCDLSENPKTSFTYDFNFPFSTGVEPLEIARQGLAELPSTLPYVLSLRSDISSVTIVDRTGSDEKVAIYSANARQQKSEGVKSVQVLHETKGTEPVDKTIYLSTVGNTTVALEYDPSNNKIIGYEKGLPRLFFSFPMIGTEEFPFPLVLDNSSKYELFPDTERNGINLENVEKGHKNRLVLEQGRDAYFKLIDYAIEQGWQNLYHFVDPNVFKENSNKDIEEWYKEEIRKKIMEKLLSSTIVETKDRLIKLSEARFPSDNKASGNDDLTTEIFGLVSFFTPISPKIPKEELLKAWNELLDFRVFKQQRYTLEQLKKDASEIGNLQKLQEILEVDPLDWLNRLINCLTFRKSDFSEYPILPCQNPNGDFQILDDLYSCSELNKNLNKELLKDLIEVQGESIRDRLIHEGISSLLITNKERFLGLEKDFIATLSTYFKERSPNQSLISIFQSKKDLLLKLLTIMPTETEFSEYRQQVYRIAQNVFDDDMPAQQKVTGWPTAFWVEADWLLFEYLASQLDGASLTTISDIFPNLQEPVSAKDWHLEFIKLIVRKNYRDLLIGKALLPAQDEVGTFRKMDSHFYVDDQVESPLKEALAKFGTKYDWRPILLDARYSPIFTRNKEQEELFFGGRVKTSQKASERINLIIGNYIAGKEDYADADVETTAFYLISHHITPSGIPDEKRRQLWKFSRDLFKEVVPDKNDATIKSFEWNKLEGWLLERLVEEISEIGSLVTEENESNSLMYLKERLRLENDEAPSETDWLDRFLNLISEEEKTLLNNYAILPNRYGDFDTLSELSSNYEMEENDGPDPIAPTSRRQIVPDKVLDALKLVARTSEEDKNNFILHERISFEIESKASLREICNIIDEALSEDNRGFQGKENIKSGVLIVKDYMEELDAERKPKFFPTLQTEIYKMAVSAMGNVARYALDIPDDLLERMSQNKNLVSATKALSSVDDETLTQISTSPDKVKNLKKALSISDQDITGISENRDAYIIEEAKKLLERINSGEEIANGTFNSDTVESLVKNLSSSSSFPVAEHQATTSEYHEKLGQWGERYINNLLAEKKESGKIHDFKWMNENGESGKPYDFKIKPREEDNKWEYVDVKTTEKEQDEPYYITDNEWRKIFKKRERFTIYRVHNADLNKEAEHCSSAAHYTEIPFTILLEWVEGQVLEHCKRSRNSSTAFGNYTKMKLN